MSAFMSLHESRPSAFHHVEPFCVSRRAETGQTAAYDLLSAIAGAFASPREQTRFQAKLHVKVELQADKSIAIATRAAVAINGAADHLHQQSRHGCSASP